MISHAWRNSWKKKNKYKTLFKKRTQNEVNNIFKCMISFDPNGSGISNKLIFLRSTRKFCDCEKEIITDHVF